MNFNDWPALPLEVTTVMSNYFRLLDKALASRITGFYLVGSVALNDYQSGQSDIDFVAVTETPLTALEVAQLTRLHDELRRSRPRLKMDGAYVTWSQLQANPLSLSIPYCHDSRFAASGFAVNPVTWSTLQRYSIALRGPAQPQALHDPESLRSWCRENLQSYWMRWIEGARTYWLRRPFTLSRQAMVWGVLGVPRLHATIKTGDILSKSAVGAYALQVFPAHWSPLIKAALEVRGGQRPTVYRNVFTRRRDMLAFMEYVIADALSA